MQVVTKRKNWISLFLFRFKSSKLITLGRRASFSILACQIFINMEHGKLSKVIFFLTKKTPSNVVLGQCIIMGQSAGVTSLNISKDHHL